MCISYVVILHLFWYVFSNIDRLIFTLFVLKMFSNENSSHFIKFTYRKNQFTTIKYLIINRIMRKSDLKRLVVIALLMKSISVNYPNSSLSNYVSIMIYNYSASNLFCPAQNYTWCECHEDIYIYITSSSQQ